MTLSWQGRCAGSPINVNATMSAWGLASYYSATDPYALLYAQIIQQTNPDTTSGYYKMATPTPAGLVGNDQSTADQGDGWSIFTEMCLRAKVILWAEFKIGDCSSGAGGISNPLAGLSSMESEASLGLTSAEAGLSIGTALAGTTVSGVLGTVGVAAIPVVGALLGPLISLFGNHAKAVAAEQEGLCQFSAEATSAIQGVYQYVQSGQATPAQGYAAMQQIASEFQTAVKTLQKSFCDGACGLIGTMNAQVILAGYLFGVTPMPSGFPASTLIARPASQAGGLIEQLEAATSTSELTSSETPATLSASQQEATPGPIIAKTSTVPSTSAASSSTLQGIPTWVIILAVGLAVLFLWR
jgi:hypothetical protein